MDHESLIKLGFKFNEWEDEGTTFTEYFIEKGRTKIEVYGDRPEVDIIFEDGDVSVPNCETISDLINLLHLFNFKTKN